MKLWYKFLLVYYLLFVTVPMVTHSAEVAGAIVRIREVHVSGNLIQVDEALDLFRITSRTPDVCLNLASATGGWLSFGEALSQASNFDFTALENSLGARPRGAAPPPRLDRPSRWDGVQDERVEPGPAAADSLTPQSEVRELLSGVQTFLSRFAAASEQTAAPPNTSQITPTPAPQRFTAMNNAIPPTIPQIPRIPAPHRPSSFRQIDPFAPPDPSLYPCDPQYSEAMHGGATGVASAYAGPSALTAPGGSNSTGEVLAALGLSSVIKDAKKFKQKYETSKRECEGFVTLEKSRGNWYQVSVLQDTLKVLIKLWTDYDYAIACGVPHEQAFQVVELGESGEKQVADTLLGMLRYPELVNCVVAQQNKRLKPTYEPTHATIQASARPGSSARKCYICQSEAHLRAQCPLANRNNAPATRSNPPGLS